GVSRSSLPGVLRHKRYRASIRNRHASANTLRNEGRGWGTWGNRRSTRRADRRRGRSEPSTEPRTTGSNQYVDNNVLLAAAPRPADERPRAAGHRYRPCAADHRRPVELEPAAGERRPLRAAGDG